MEQKESYITKVDSSNRVIVDARVREHLGIKPGDTVKIIIEILKSTKTK